MADSARLSSLDPLLLVRTLAEHHVEYVMIGALGARLGGYPLMTADADITPARRPENLARLAAALRVLEAKVFTPAVPEGLVFDCSDRTLARADIWSLVTRAGRLDIIFNPPGVEGYDELAKDAQRYEVAGAAVDAASLEAIIRMKEASRRPKDRQAVAIIKAMLERDARRQR